MPKPIYLRFESEVGGGDYLHRLEALLDAGVVPEEFSSTAAGKLTLAELNREYQVALHVPDEDRVLLNAIHARLGKTLSLTLVDKWVERWVSDMKREQNLAPSTICHYVGALIRCFAWVCRSGQHPELVINPLELLRADVLLPWSVLLADGGGTASRFRLPSMSAWRICCGRSKGRRLLA